MRGAARLIVILLALLVSWIGGTVGAVVWVAAWHHEAGRVVALRQCWTCSASPWEEEMHCKAARRHWHMKSHLLKAEVWLLCDCCSRYL